MGTRSAAATGQYYKGRSRRWLEGRGYVVALLERMHVIPRPGRPIFVKKDQLGCDLLAVNGEHVLFVQVKFFGSRAKVYDLQVRAARQEFARFPCPPGARQEVHVWRRGGREPEVIDARAEC